MVLYELITVTRPKRVHEAKDIARLTGSMILSQRGVIRSVANWGQYLLSAPIRKNQERHQFGHHTIMRFDAASGTQAAIKKMLRVDPRVLKFGLVRLGDGTLKGTNEYAEIGWTKRSTEDRMVKKDQAVFAGRMQ